MIRRAVGNLLTERFPASRNLSPSASHTRTIKRISAPPPELKSYQTHQPQTRGIGYMDEHDKIADLDKRNALLQQRVENLETDNRQYKADRQKAFWGIIGLIGAQIYDLIVGGKIGG